MANDYTPMLRAMAIDLTRLLEEEVPPFEFGDVPDSLLELYWTLKWFLEECGEPLDPNPEDTLSQLHKDW